MQPAHGLISLCPSLYKRLAKTTLTIFENLHAVTGERNPVKFTDWMMSLQDNARGFLHHRRLHLDSCPAHLGVIASALTGVHAMQSRCEQLWQLQLQDPLVMCSTQLCNSTFIPHVPAHLCLCATLFVFSL